MLAKDEIASLFALQILQMLAVVDPGFGRTRSRLTAPKMARTARTEDPHRSDCLLFSPPSFAALDGLHCMSTPLLALAKAWTPNTILGR